MSKKISFSLDQDQLLKDLSKLDCLDNTCHFKGRGPGGMRTNGGCRCLRDTPRELKRELIIFYRDNKHLL